jgi:hypothetical protein
MNKDELIGAIQQCARKLGRTPTTRELLASTHATWWQIQKLLGGWDEALRAAGLEKRVPAPNPSKEEILQQLRRCARGLGRTPTKGEFSGMKNTNMRHLLREFGNWTRAVRASGLKVHPGSPANAGTLLEDWGELVRKKGRFPTKLEYEIHTHHAISTLRKSAGGWADVPQAFRELVKKHGTQKRWADVLQLIAKNGVRKPRVPSTTVTAMNSGTGCARCRRPERQGYWKLLADRRVYGTPLMLLSLAFGPINEMGVVFLFGTLARDLGFLVTWIGSSFPDWEAVREVGPGQLQHVKVEFELESRNFLRHNHNPAGCDLIICWVHNWPECPLEVIELSKLDCVKRAMGVDAASHR